tara:strand:+ start:206 stop:502 length:297 start_codon:yes stop_codon:yes gene_type:complete
MEYMQVYQYILETESERYHYYFSYEISPKDLVILAADTFGDEVSLVDAFPEPNVKKGHLTKPLRIITKIGKEMYLPEGMNVEIISKYRALFQYVEAPL